MPIGDNIDPAALDAATMADMPAADMSGATAADIAAMPPKQCRAWTHMMTMPPSNAGHGCTR